MKGDRSFYARKPRTPRAGLGSVEQVVVVQLVVVLHDLPLDLGSVHPSDKVLETAGHKERRVGDRLRSDTHVPLLDERHCLAECLGHLQAHHHHCQPASAEGGHGELVAERQTLLRRNNTQEKQLLEQLLRQLYSNGIPGVHLLHDADQSRYHATQLVVLLVVVAVLDMVPAHYLRLTVSILALPLQEVNLLEKLTLVMLERPHHAAV
eukprot:6282114-Pyramimonas_sp.AAC.1